MTDPLPFKTFAELARWTAEDERNHLARKRRARGFPIVYDSTEVRVRDEPFGEPLSEPVYWVGRQWAVTAYGVEARDGTYAIEKARLHEGCDGSDWTWEQHMAEKEWVDLEDLRTALMWARGFFAMQPKPTRGKSRR